MSTRRWVALGILILLLLGAILGFRIVQQNEDSQQMRIELLEDALAPDTASQAAHDWAKAVQSRNGAWQYALMNEELRRQYLEEFEASNWVTGFSSPWVERYFVTRESVDPNGDVNFKVKFDWYTSAGYFGTNYATLKVHEYDEGIKGKTWLITYLDFSYNFDQGTR